MSVMVARADGVYKTADGVMYRLNRGQTTADANHPVVTEFPDAWVPFAVHLPAPAGESEALTEAEDLNDHYQAILTTISDGLETRGLLADIDMTADGWLVTAVFRAIDGEPEPAEVSEDPATVRAWAIEQGLTTSDRGRIPAAVLDAFRKAHA